MNNSIIINSTSNTNKVTGLELGKNYIFKYALSNIIYEQDNILNESLNYGGETIIKLLTVPERVKNLRFCENKDELVYSDKKMIEWDKLHTNNDIPLMIISINYLSITKIIIINIYLLYIKIIIHYILIHSL